MEDVDIDCTVPLNEHLHRALLRQFPSGHAMPEGVTTVRFLHKRESPYTSAYLPVDGDPESRFIILEGFCGDVFEHLPFDALQIMKKLYKK